MLSVSGPGLSSDSSKDAADALSRERLEQRLSTKCVFAKAGSMVKLLQRQPRSTMQNKKLRAP